MAHKLSKDLKSADPAPSPPLHAGARHVIISSDLPSRPVSKKSLYGDPIWDLTAEHPELNPADVTLDFSRLTFSDGSNLLSPEHLQYLPSVKAFAYSMLVDPPASYPKWSTFCANFNRGLKYLVRFMSDRHITSFSHLTETDVAQFLDIMSENRSSEGKRLTATALRARLYGLSWLYEQSGKLEDGLRSDPFADYGSLVQWAESNCERKSFRLNSTTIEMPDTVAKELLTRALEDLALVDRIEELQKARAAYVRVRIRKRNQKEITANPFPWEKYGLANGTQVNSLEPRLAASCYIVIAMLTGMRFHEIVAIKSGAANHWSEEFVEADGLQRKCCFVISKTNKLQANPTEYMWQALPSVKEALEAAERGLRRRRGAGDFLFPALKNGTTRLSDSTLGSILNTFVATHNIRFNGALWPVASHQFRKKFARLMVRYGLGMKELQDQLKHFDIEMTRAYSDMNLYVELQREKFELSEEQYEELLSNNVPVIGGGAKEMRRNQARFLGLTKAERASFLAQLPKTTVVEQLDDGLCLYRPEKALCGGNKAACRPADCNNAVLPASGKRKIMEWRRKENDRLLAHFQADPLKASFLARRNEELDKLLLQLDEAEQGMER